jgi:hypothetical protein
LAQKFEFSPFYSKLIRAWPLFTFFDYRNSNPIKQGWVKQVKDWLYSTFHRYVKKGFYPANWGCEMRCFPDQEFGESWGGGQAGG